MKELWELFSSFARIGGFTFGGGYAMLTMLQKEVVEKRQWATEDEMLDYFAIGQGTPGVIFINTATFIGYKQKGIPGAIAATVGSVFPSLCIVMFIAAVLKNFAELAVVQHAFAGIRVVVSVLILNAVMGLRKKSIVDKLCVVIAAVSFLVSVWVDISPVWIVLAAAILGIAGFLRKGGEGEMMSLLILIFEFFKIGCFPSAAVWQRCPSSTVWRINIHGFPRSRFPI